MIFSACTDTSNGTSTDMITSISSDTDTSTSTDFDTVLILIIEKLTSDLWSASSCVYLVVERISGHLLWWVWNPLVFPSAWRTCTAFLLQSSGLSGRQTAGSSLSTSVPAPIES